MKMIFIYLKKKLLMVKTKICKAFQTQEQQLPISFVFIEAHFS